MNIVFLVAAFASCALVTGTYAVIARWTKYPAGRAIMWLLCALTVATGYWLFGRFIPGGVRPFFSNFTGLIVIVAVLGVGRVIVLEQLRGYKNKVSHGATNRTEI